MANILIVEDEKPINNLIRKNLEAVGHSCTSAFDGEAVFNELEKQQFDLILLDIMLPKMDGFEVLAHIEGMPVIYLTARDSVDDRVRGLKLGADDYITKPFHVIELQARVEAVLRRAQKTDKTFVLRDVEVDLHGRLVYFKGALVDFTPQEYALVETFIKNRNIALSRDKLLEIAWGYEFGGDTRTVDAHISRIRKKLHWEDTIKTVYKLGYRLEARHEA
ncbi:MAG: response regulator transcription factor [Defluviitaleaceae bacterium]|nr:response regulator transcription factor [Defluviitaleaceae bacterium]